MIEVLPPVVTDAAIESELPGALAWAQRHQIALDTRLLAERIIRAVLVRQDTEEKFYLQGRFDNYKALPPAWDWWNENWSEADGLHLSPSPESTPFGSSMFFRHGNRGVICAPFNRLAYDAHHGPHSDWGGPAQWITAGPQYIHAVTIGDMLHSILRDFRFSKGRMG